LHDFLPIFLPLLIHSFSFNLVPLIVDAVEAYATLGEISDAMRRVFGEQQEFRSLE